MEIGCLEPGGWSCLPLTQVAWTPQKAKALGEEKGRNLSVKQQIGWEEIQRNWGGSMLCWRGQAPETLKLEMGGSISNRVSFTTNRTDEALKEKEWCTANKARILIRRIK